MLPVDRASRPRQGACDRCTARYGAVVAGYIFGGAFIAFALWRLTRNRATADCIIIAGTVTSEVSRRSSQTGSRKLLHAPEANYVDPETGEVMTYEPTRFSGDRYQTGQAVELLYDATGKVTHRQARPIKDASVLLLVGFGLIAAQYFGG